MSYISTFNGIYSGSIPVAFKVDDQGRSFAIPGTIFSELNSSTIPISASSSFTGSADKNDTPDVMVSCKTDKSGVLYFDFSNDGVNWDTFPTNGFTVTANIHEFHTAVKGPRYFRARLSNTSNQNQTYLRLYTYTGTFRQANLPINQSISSDNDATLVRSIQVAETPSGNYQNANIDGYAFSTSTPLLANSTISSSVLNTDGYSQLQTELYSDKSGILIGRWYADESKTKLIRTFRRPYSSNETGSYVYFSSPVFGPYVQYTYENDNQNQSSFYLGLKFLVKSISGQVLGLTDFIPDNVVANLGRNIIVGETDGGQFVNVPVSNEGHLEVEVHSPRLPFGSIHTENLTPVFQNDAVYGINSEQVTVTNLLSGVATADNSSFVCSTGTSAFGFATIQSKKRLRYRPGQGVVGRFAGSFTTGVPNSYQVMGLGHPEDGVYFAYSGSSFGILYNNRGKRETRILRITNGSTSNSTATVVLNNVSHSISVTNNTNVNRTAYEIFRGNFNTWSATVTGSSVIFVSNTVGSKTGKFGVSGSGIVGGFSRLQSGAETTASFISQSNWNGDTMDGTGRSGINLNPTNGNVYQIGVQYLGSGPITFYIEGSKDGNNPNFINVHTIPIQNSIKTTSFGNPSFPFTMASYSAGSTTDLTVKVGSFGGMIEGKKILHGNRYSYFNTITTTGDTNLQCLFTILNSEFYKNRTNQSVINILDVASAVKHTQPVSVYLIKNGTLTGTPIFKQYSSNSCAYYDTSATTITYSDNSQLIWVGQLAETSALEKSFADNEEIVLQPGEWLTLAAKTATGNAPYVAGTINTREDQ